MRVLLGLILLAGWTLPAVVAADPTKEARKKAAEKRFDKLEEYLKERRVSHVVELLAEWGEFADADQQDDVFRWVADLRENEEGIGCGFIYQPPKRIVSSGAKATPEVSEGEYPSAFFVDEFSRDPPPKKWRNNEVVGAQLVVASKTLVVRPNKETAHACVVLTNAAVAEFEGLDGCLVISSGSVSVAKRISKSAVMCRGNLEYAFDLPPFLAGKGRVWAGGTITDVNVIADRRLKPDGESVVEKDDKLLGLKFYSCAEDGLTATADAKMKAISVSKLDAKKPFAKAGVKEGDVIETINGEKVPTLHELDRLLCRATVASGVAKLKVKRDGKAEEIEVKLADW